jgi:peptidoglycan/LPS O-acetylase OafA/YrhL
MNKPSRHRYQVLDSLRGICACMVVLFHFHVIGWISNLSLVRNSWMFVDFFFVLSGFVIATAYRRRLADGFPIGSFMWLRMGRIYPVHLFVTALFIALQLVLLVKGGSGKAFQGDMSIGSLVASLTLTQTFVASSGVAWNAPSWSIAVEMWTYLVFAIMFRVFGSMKSLVAACAIMAAASCACVAKSHHGNLDDVYFGAIFRCTYGFALGVIGAELRVLVPALVRAPVRDWLGGSWTSAATALELIALSLVGAFIAAAGRGPFSMVAPVMFLALIMLFANESGAVSGILKTRIPLLLGELSYSIYMVHLFLLYRISGLVSFLHKGSLHPFLLCESDTSCTATGSPWMGNALIVPVLVLVIGAAYLLRSFIEAPCERWAKNALARQAQSRFLTAWMSNWRRAR